MSIDICQLRLFTNSNSKAMGLIVPLSTALAVSGVVGLLLAAQADLLSTQATEKS